MAWWVFTPLLLAVRRLTPKGALFWGAAAGGIANLGTLYWVYPTCRWGGVGVGLSAMALLALAGYLAVYWALFAVVARSLDRYRAARPFLLAAVWTALEFIRTHAFTGFPWLLLAHSQWEVPRHLPLSAIGGAFLVSFLVMLFNGTAALWVEGLGEKRKGAWRSLLPAFAVLAVLTGWSVSLWRRDPTPAGPAVPVALVQGNIDQYKKWDDAYEKEIVTAYEGLTRKAAAQGPALILWPETAVPGWIPNDEKYRRWLAGLAREARVPLLFGAVSRQGGKDHNAAFLMSPTGELIGEYRKQHLVPFGEYVPGQAFWGRFVGVLNALGGFDAGDASTLLRAPVPLGVSICYEGLFPGLVSALTRAGAEILVNITNDGWYRHTAAPEQHLAANVFRAVENRRWLIRVANTGFSGVINPRGEVVARSDLLTPAVVRGAPVPLTGLTFYARHGDLFAWGCFWVSLLVCLRPWWHRKKLTFPPPRVV